MGVALRHDAAAGTLEVDGQGLEALKKPDRDLYVGNSGTTMRLLLGILAGRPFEAVLSGDASLTSRPMRRVTDPLKKMGAQIKGREQGNFAPLIIRGGRLQGIRYENHLGSAQVKSAILFAGMQAEGETCIVEPFPSRDHTERLLQAAGAGFELCEDGLKVRKSSCFRPLEFEIPGDISSAAFFITAAAMIPGSELKVEKTGLNPRRTGLLDVLRRMGARIEVSVTARDPEPAGTITVCGARLRGTGINRSEIPGLIDELPVLMTAMALAEGESLISGAEELRVKETDRIQSMAVNLNTLGGSVEELPDGCLIRGVESLKGGKVRSFGDHRTAMSMAVASLVAEGAVEIEDTACIATSFPGFLEMFERLRTS